jgi:hypothetical protein
VAGSRILNTPLKQLLGEAQEFLSFIPKTKNLLNPKGTRKQDASPALCALEGSALHSVMLDQNHRVF